MKTSKIIVVLIWIAAFIQIMPNAFIDPSNFLPDPPLDGGMHLIFLLFPIAFFGVSAFVIRRYPFDVLLIRQIVDKKFGIGTYANFIMELKPMFLFGFAALGTSLALLYASYHAGSPYHFFFSEIMASAGIAFLLMRIILQKRGLLMEASPGQASWGGREFLPFSIRKIRPTKLTAMFTGAWTVIGMLIVQAIAHALHADPSMDAMAFFVGSIFFFFIPIAIFVFGYQYSPDIKEGETELALHGRRLGGAMVRGLCWLLGGGISMVILTLIGSLLQKFTP